MYRRLNELLGQPVLAIFVEFVIVLAGVLAALALGQWIEGQATRERVASALVSLETELLDNSQIADDRTDYHTDALAQLDGHLLQISE